MKIRIGNYREENAWLENAKMLKNKEIRKKELQLRRLRTGPRLAEAIA